MLNANREATSVIINATTFTANIMAWCNTSLVLQLARTSGEKFLTKANDKFRWLIWLLACFTLIKKPFAISTLTHVTQATRLIYVDTATKLTKVIASKQKGRPL